MIRGILIREENEVKNKLVRLCEMVEASIQNATVALTTLDKELARKIVDNDAQINALQRDVEDECLTLIATQQPVASDLRIVFACVHVAIELERIADHAAGIANTLLQTPIEQSAYDLLPIVDMAGKCQQMLKRAINAFINNDWQEARLIAEMDHDIDSLQSKQTGYVISKMCENADNLTFGTGLLWIIHSLERIGDRVTNICEQVIFINTGENVDLNR